MAHTIAHLESKLKQSEVSNEVCIADIDWSLYTKPKRFSTSLFVSDLELQILVYPNGSKTARKLNFCSVFFNVVDAKEDDHRFVKVSFRCDLGDFSIHPTKVSHFFNNRKSKGHSAPFKSSALKNLKSIQFKAIVYEDTSHIVPKNIIGESFARQLKKMHDHSIRHGDITLVVTLHSGEDEDGGLYVPQSKKRRKNHNVENNKEIELKMSSSILRSASPVFDRMLSPNNSMIEQQQNKVTVYAKSVEDVKDLLYFMTTDELVPDCNVFNIMQLAQFYQMERLIWKCINRLIQNISVKNFVDTINVFDRYDISEGYESLVEFAKENIDDLKKESNYLSLSHSFRCVVLGESKRILA